MKTDINELLPCQMSGLFSQISSNFSGDIFSKMEKPNSKLFISFYRFSCISIKIVTKNDRIRSLPFKNLNSLQSKLINKINEMSYICAAGYSASPSYIMLSGFFFKFFINQRFFVYIYMHTYI